MTEHPKNETQWSDDDDMERIFAAWVQSRPADAAATEATSTDPESPEPPAAGATSADPATEDVPTGERATDGGPAVDEGAGDEPVFPKSLARKTSLPNWFVDEPSPAEASAGKPAAAFPAPAQPAVFPEPSAFPGPAAHDDAAANDEAALANRWHDDASFADATDGEPASTRPETETPSKGVATSTGWTRTDDDVIPKGGKRRWGRKGR